MNWLKDTAPNAIPVVWIHPQEIAKTLGISKPQAAKLIEKTTFCQQVHDLLVEGWGEYYEVLHEAARRSRP